MMPSIHSAVELQDLYIEKRDKVAQTMLSVCVADNVEQEIINFAIYTLIRFNDPKYITELLKVVIQAKKTELLRVALLLFKKNTSSPTLLIDYIRPLDDDSRKQVITLLGIQGRSINYKVSDLDPILEWFYYNDTNLEVREVASKYLVMSDREEWIVFGIPSLGCVGLALVLLLAPVGLASGITISFFERFSALSLIAICLSPVHFILSVFLLRWSRNRPLARFALICVMILSIVFVYLKLY